MEAACASWLLLPVTKVSKVYFGLSVEASPGAMGAGYLWLPRPFASPAASSSCQSSFESGSAAVSGAASAPSSPSSVGCSTVSPLAARWLPRWLRRDADYLIEAETLATHGRAGFARAWLLRRGLDWAAELLPDPPEEPAP